MKLRIAAILFSLQLAACSNVMPPSPASAPVPSATFTAIPTLMATPASSPVPTSPPGAAPDAEWNGIPIMPGALVGEGDSESYVFMINATPQQVQDYYRAELAKLGWQPFAQEDGDSSTMLMFMNSAAETLTLSVIAKGDQALVLLVK